MRRYISPAMTHRSRRFQTAPRLRASRRAVEGVPGAEHPDVARDAVPKGGKLRPDELAMHDLPPVRFPGAHLQPHLEAGIRPEQSHRAGGPPNARGLPSLSY